MALRIWASSTANALKVSAASRPNLSPAFSLSRCFSSVLDGLKYASSHEWVKHEGAVATIGITDHAQVSHFLHSSENEQFEGQDYGQPPKIRKKLLRAYNRSWHGLMRPHDHLGEVVFVELPELGTSVSQGKGFGAVESVKATSDINSPISGEVIEINSKLTEGPGAINSSPYDEGWMIKVKPSSPAELESLMGAKEYTKFCEEEDAAH